MKSFSETLSFEDAKVFWENYRSLTRPLASLVNDRIKLVGSRVGYDSNEYEIISHTIDRAIFKGEIAPDVDIEEFIDHDMEWHNLEVVNNLREKLQSIRKAKPAGELFDAKPLLELKQKAKELSKHFDEIRVTDQYVLSTLNLLKSEIAVTLSYSI